MKTKAVPKRSPVLALILCTAIGITLLATSRPTSQSRTTPLAESAQTAFDTALAQFRAVDEEMRLSARQTQANQGWAPEAHAYGFELLQRGDVTSAISVLSDGCETGDLTACSVLGDAYLKQRRLVDAEKAFSIACEGGQLVGCRSLLDHESISEQAQSKAFTKLTSSCRDRDDALACMFIAESRWAQNDSRRERIYLGLACARGEERGCAAPSSDAL